MITDPGRPPGPSRSPPFGSGCLATRKPSPANPGSNALQKGRASLCPDLSSPLTGSSDRPVPAGACKPESPPPGSKGSLKTNLVNRMVKNHLTQPPFLDRAARAAGAGLQGWVETLAGRGADGPRWAPAPRPPRTRHDDAGAMTPLGPLHLKGRGITRDHAQARRWFQKAAAAGSATAMHNLGRCASTATASPRITPKCGAGADGRLSSVYAPVRHLHLTLPPQQDKEPSLTDQQHTKRACDDAGHKPTALAA
jgi:hypothetical protein